MRRVYLDHNATTPVRREAREAVAEALGHQYGNASSIHRHGHLAKMLIESARESLAALLGARSHEVLFTSGGTEANNLALTGAARSRGTGHLIVSRIEHSSVLQPAAALERDGFRVTRVPASPQGWVDPDRVLEAVAPDTVLISLIHSSNELGTLQRVEEVAQRIHGRGILLHTDAVQSGGKVPLDVSRLGVDLLSLSAHKLGGPQGVGCLWIRDGVALSPLLRGGGQESNRRAGTEALPLIAGFGVAARLAAEEISAESSRLRALRDRLEAELERRCAPLRFHGRGAPRLPNTVSVAFEGILGEELVMALDLEGISVSTGSACAAGTIRPSHVLEAMGCSREEARSTLRISLGHGNTEADLEALVENLEKIRRRKAELSVPGQPALHARALAGASGEPT